MKRNFARVLADVFGNPITERRPSTAPGAKPGDTELVAITLRDVAITALVNDPPTERPEGEVKFKRYQLARRLQQSKSGVVDVTAEEIADIKKLLSMIYSPGLMGPAWEALEEEHAPAVVEEVPGHD